MNILQLLRHWLGVLGKKIYSFQAGALEINLWNFGTRKLDSALCLLIRTAKFALYFGISMKRNWLAVMDFRKISFVFGNIRLCRKLRSCADIKIECCIWVWVRMAPLFVQRLVMKLWDFGKFSRDRIINNINREKELFLWIIIIMMHCGKRVENYNIY